MEFFYPVLRGPRASSVGVHACEISDRRLRTLTSDRTRVRRRPYRQQGAVPRDRRRAGLRLRRPRHAHGRARAAHELVAEKEKYKDIGDDLDTAFVELILKD
ncbi:unnamed protein product [Arctia plantaginis]|uniref:Uncharacterized protein n=1 Tax=Arctia plantaginis TaxID=874455 RepID=A0A8S1AEH7_ARCPL|nr:unnamed protein product [Arctia plantaginis]